MRSPQILNAALFIALVSSNSLQLRRLLKQKADPNITIDNATPLFIASQEGELNLVDILLKANADPNIPIEDGATPLYIAVEEKRLDIVNLLLKAKADTDLAMENGKNPLYLASEFGHLGIVNSLIKGGANLDSQIDDGATPLYIASEFGNFDVVKALLGAGANPDLAMHDGDTPMIVSVRMNNLDIFKALFEAGANPTLVNVRGFDALASASAKGNLSIVKLLIEYEKKNSIEDFSVALVLASGYGHLEIVKVFLEAGADINSIPNLPDVASSLFLASQNGHLETVRTLLENGADVNSVYSKTNSSPLNKALERGHLEIVNLLLAQENIDISIEDRCGNTSLDIASHKGHLEIVKALLVKKGKGWKLSRAMNFAFMSNNFDILEEFYKKIVREISVSSLLSFQIYLFGTSSDEDKINKSLEILFNFLSEDKKIELLTVQKNGKTILEHAVENNHYSVASLIYSKTIDLIYKDDAECQAMKSKILIKALKNYSNENEFFEFIKLVNGNEKLLPELEIEIQELKLLESPENQIKIDNALAEIKKTQEKHLTDVWKLYKAGDLEGFASLINEDPTKILSFKYIEDKQDRDHPQKTFLHRLAEDNGDKGGKFLKQTFALIAGLKKAGKEVPNLDLPCDIEYRDNKGEVHGVTPLYMAIFKRNENAVKYLIPYSNLNAPIIKENFDTKTKTPYSLFELALEKATLDSSNPTLDSSNPTLDSSNSKKSFEILKMITKEGDKKACFPESEEQKRKIISKFNSYDSKIKNLLKERYPDEIRELKELAPRYGIVDESLLAEFDEVDKDQVESGDSIVLSSIFNLTRGIRGLHLTESQNVRAVDSVQVRRRSSSRRSEISGITRGVERLQLGDENGPAKR